jgi:YD repeat-containing protein
MRGNVKKMIFKNLLYMSKSGLGFLFSILIICISTYGQKIEVNKITSKEYYPQSPSAASLGVFGQTAVSFFTGTPDINVALADIRYKELSLDLTLIYQNTMGNKPDVIPGYTGNGWFLRSGGAITMTSKGISPADVGKSTTIQILPYATNGTSWKDSSTLSADMFGKKFPYDYSGKRYDEFSYSFAGSSGAFYSDYDDSRNGPYQHIKTAQGEDLIVQKIVLQGLKSIKIPIEPQPAQTSLSFVSWNANLFDSTGAQAVYYRDTIIQNTLTYGFIITDSRGIKYTFGGTDESLEFTRPGLLPVSFDQLGQNTIPTTWYLTSIQSPNGALIRLRYRRGDFYTVSTSYVKGMVITSNKDASTHVFSGSTALPYSRLISGTMYNPCYLDSVITPISYTKFYWSKAKGQLSYSVPHLAVNDTVNSFSPYIFDPYPEVSNSAGMDKRFSDKLDSFTIFKATGARNSAIQFTYTNDTTTRLKLTSVNIQGSSGINGSQKYSFSYSTLALPPYRSFKIDKYGYYNGRNLYITTSQDPNYYVTLLNNSTQLNGYIQSREPDTAYTQAEILQRVTYPTGGYTEYEYENNKYGSFADNWPNTVVVNASDSIGAGLRIKTITNYDFTGHKASQKKYYYYSNYSTGGRTSSGVLNFKPLFYAHYAGPVSNPQVAGDLNDPRFINVSINYTQFGTDPLYPARYTKGVPVNYSEVAEVLADGSYTLYTFKNYDNGYHDKPAENIYVDNPVLGRFWQEDDVNSLDLERGQILSERRYDTSGLLRLKKTYEYNDSTSRYNSNVRMLKVVPNPAFSENFLTMRYLAYLVYTYYPYLKKQATYEYTSPTDSIVTTVSYAYDSNYRMIKVQTQTMSDSSVRTTLSRYPADMVSSGQSDPYLTMVNSHMVSQLVEKEDQLNGIKLQKAITSYKTGLSDNTALILPSSVSSQFRNRPSEIRLTYDRYDSLGNLLSFSQPGGLRTNYIWSYNKQYLVAQVVNAPYSAVADVLGGTPAINTFSNLSDISSPAIGNLNLISLRTDSRLNGAQVTSWNYLPLTGVTSEMDPSGKSTFYEYDGLGRLSTIRNSDQAVIKQFCYNYAGQPESCRISEGIVQQNYFHSPNKGWVCDTAGHQFDIQLVSVYALPTFSPSSYISFQVNNLYANSGLTLPLSDGYYVSTTGLSFYFPASFYIKNGQIFYANICTSSGPFSLQFTDNITNHDICDSIYPTQYVYTVNSDTPAIGRSLYSNYQLSTPVSDGYYLYNGSVYHTASGIVDQKSLCSILFPPVPSLHTISLKKGANATTACTTTALFLNMAFLSTSPIATIGDKLYLGYPTFVAGAGFYSDGTKGYILDSNGIIIQTYPCP